MEALSHALRDLDRDIKASLDYRQILRNEILQLRNGSLRHATSLPLQRNNTIRQIHNAEAPKDRTSAIAMHVLHESGTSPTLESALTLDDECGTAHLVSSPTSEIKLNQDAECGMMHLASSPTLEIALQQDEECGMMHLASSPTLEIALQQDEENGTMHLASSPTLEYLPNLTLEPVLNAIEDSVTMNLVLEITVHYCPVTSS